VGLEVLTQTYVIIKANINSFSRDDEIHFSSAIERLLKPPRDYFRPVQVPYLGKLFFFRKAVNSNINQEIPFFRLPPASNADSKLGSTSPLSFDKWSPQGSEYTRSSTN
jgi:hypothetical protein